MSYHDLGKASIGAPVSRVRKPTQCFKNPLTVTTRQPGNGTKPEG
jgi:hypothetical protein